MALIDGNMTTSHHMTASGRIQCKDGERCDKVMKLKILQKGLKHITSHQLVHPCQPPPLFKIPFFVVTAQKTALHSYISARNMLTLIKSVFS